MSKDRSITLLDYNFVFDLMSSQERLDKAIEKVEDGKKTKKLKVAEIGKILYGKQ